MKNLRMITIFYFTVFLYGCVDNAKFEPIRNKDITPENNTSGYSNQIAHLLININGSYVYNGKFQGGCEKVSAGYYPLDIKQNKNPNMKEIFITAKDGQSELMITLWFSGKLESNPQFTLNGSSSNSIIDNHGFARFIPDLNSPYGYYGTTENTFGSLFITKYDQSNQRISGAYSFPSQQMKNGLAINVSKNSRSIISGAFTNMPINDYSDPKNPKGPCFNSIKSLVNYNN